MIRNATRSLSYGNDNGEGWNPDLLQGLGRRTADCFFPRLAAERGRLGRADALLWAAWLSRDRSRSARPPPVQPDLGRQPAGHVTGRYRGAIWNARPQQYHHG